MYVYLYFDNRTLGSCKEISTTCEESFLCGTDYGQGGKARGFANSPSVLVGEFKLDSADSRDRKLTMYVGLGATIVNQIKV